MSRVDDMADAFWRTLCRAKALGPNAQLGKISLEILELTYPSRYFFEMLI
jgi:hypothetical protein